MTTVQRDRLAGIAARMRYWSQHWWRDSDTVRAAIRVDEFAAEIESLLAEPEAPQAIPSMDQGDVAARLNAPMHTEAQP